MSAKDFDHTNQSFTRTWNSDGGDTASAYEQFRALSREGFLPWTAKSIADVPFRARFDGAHIDETFVGRIDVVPTTCTRTKSDIANSSGEYFCASFNLAGLMTVEQRDVENTTRPGDLVIFDSGRPAQVTCRPRQGRHMSGAIALMIPKQRFDCELGNSFDNVVIPREKLLPALSNTFTLLTDRLPVASLAEVTAITEACIELLPVAAGCFDRTAQASDSGLTANGKLRQVLAFIDTRLGDPRLSAQSAAEAFSLSERYIHKLFAHTGLTFGAYVMAQRLAHVRNELLNEDSRIASIAYKWGFNDLTTFNRAFRRRYGCTPRALRGTIVGDSY